MRLNLINCKKCGVLFKKRIRNICEKCVDIEKANIKKISKYVDSYPEPYLTLQQISEGAGIDYVDLEDIYKNGLLLTYVTNRIIVTCKMCGIENKGSDMLGYFCKRCVEMSGATPTQPDEAKIELRKFHRNIMHSNRSVDDQERLKYGFKTNRDTDSK